MLKEFKGNVKKKLYLLRAYFVAKLSKLLVSLLMRTCRVEVEGLEHFIKTTETEKCMIMLWHNRLAIIPYLLNRYTQKMLFAALVSGSRDGAILSAIVCSYKRGRTIKVTHHERYHALREIVRHVEERKQIVIITPDGPRGPCYDMKPGIALTALETQAYVVPLDWQSDRFWEFNTWDRLRIPKPFTTIVFKFLPPLRLDSLQGSLEDAKTLLKMKLPQ